MGTRSSPTKKTIPSPNATPTKSSRTLSNKRSTLPLEAATSSSSSHSISSIGLHRSSNNLPGLLFSSGTSRESVRSTPQKVRKGKGAGEKKGSITQQQLTSLISTSSSSTSLRQDHRNSSDDPETSFSLDESGESTSEEEEEEGSSERPVRKKGFGVRLEGGSSTESEREFETAEDDSSTESLVVGPVEEDGKQENVVVCLRVRPTKSHSAAIYKYTPSEGRLGLEPAHPNLLKRGAMTRPSTASTVREEYEFKFDALHLAPLPTEDLYETKIRPVVRASMEGFNGTVFAYGQTASGKTHTMIGNDDEPGIIPLAISELFSFISDQDTSRSFSLRVSFLEIYNENFNDLLLSTPRTSNSKPLEVHGEDGHVKGLVERPVSSAADVLAILEEGETRRRTGCTEWNERSSRSHCVFVVTIESMSKSAEGVARTSRLNLIDLAGSEAATKQDDRRKEGAFINKSLLTLGTVIAKLTEVKTGSGIQHIPYRDSKLTRLLQPALSGNSRVAIICTISPDVEQATETLSTLKFAKRAKMVVTKAERGVFMTDRMLLQVYATQVATLQAQIASRESSIEAAEMAKERDSAIARVDELQSRSQKAEDELARKELELTRLKQDLAHTESYILTGPSLDQNARRTSGGFPSMMSPTKGRRVMSGPTGFGLGSPRGAVRAVSRSIEGELSEAESLKLATALQSLTVKDEEVITLQKNLETATESFTSTRTELEVLTTTHQSLQKELGSLRLLVDALRSKVVTLSSASATSDKSSFAELEALRHEIITSKADLVIANAAKEAAAKKQVELKNELANKVAESASKGTKLVDLETQLRRAESDLKESVINSKRLESREGSLEREVAFAKKELAAVVVKGGVSLQAVKDSEASLILERDIALASAGAAKTRVEEVESIAEVEAGRHEMVERDLRKTHEAELASLRAEIFRLEKELENMSEKAHRLQRTADAREKLELQHAAYSLSSKAGSNSLKDKLAQMQLRGSLPPSTASNPSSRSNSISSRQESADALAELQIKNLELLARIADLERLPTIRHSISSTFGPVGLNSMGSSHDLAKASAGSTAAADLKERERLNSIIESQNALLRESQETADSWREQYLKSQEMLDRLSSSPVVSSHHSTHSLDSTFSFESTRNSTVASPRPLSELNIASSSSPRQTRSKASLQSAIPPLKYRNSPSSQTLSSPHTGPGPAPLPYSPRNTEKERKARRETIQKDLARLTDAKGVGKYLEQLDSPGWREVGYTSTRDQKIDGTDAFKVRDAYLQRVSKASTKSGSTRNQVSYE